MKPVVVIGMGLSPADLTAAHLKRIEQADILVGGKRHLDCFPASAATKKVITRDISGIVDYIRDHLATDAVVVLASGDPLFYGIGSVLIRALGPDRVSIYPNITAVSGAFSRIKEPWHDAHVISLHGRDRESALRRALETKDKIVVFTDTVKTPAWIAKFVLEIGFSQFDMCVLEQLGSPAEKIRWFSPVEAVDETFQDPNILILKRMPSIVESGVAESGKQILMGAPDDWYAHEKGLITKAEVRAVTLSKLRLLPHHILWDLGAGSGSVSIEAAAIIRKGRIFAVEKNRERVRHMEANRNRFGVANLHIVHAEAPEGLADLPGADRIFIGGGGKDLPRIIACATEHLNPEGIVVINTVLLQNHQAAGETLTRLGCKTETVQIQVNRSRKMPWGERLEAQNPVWIVTGQRVVS